MGIVFQESPGGSMGSNYRVFIQGIEVGHLYLDDAETDMEDLEALLEEVGEVT